MATTAWLLTVNAIDSLIIHRKLEIKTIYHNCIFTAASYLHLYIHVVSVSQLMHLYCLSVFHCIWSEWCGQGFGQRDGVGTRRCKGLCIWLLVWSHWVTFVWVTKNVCLHTYRSNVFMKKNAFCSLIHFICRQRYLLDLCVQRASEGSFETLW